MTMLFNIIVALCVIATVAASNAHQQTNRFYSDNEVFQKYQFEEFKRTWRKTYSTVAEEVTRFKAFISNLKMIDMRNILEGNNNGTATHGITMFSDLTPEEFKARYLTVDISKPMKSEAKMVSYDKKVSDSTGLVDWTGVYTTPVKDQGYCGSCWAFSATEQVESDSMRVLGTSYILSPQQLVSCDTQSQGCSGGWPQWGWTYLQGAGGQEQESSYPYTSYYGTAGTCSADAAQNVVSLTGYYQLTGATSSAIETSMAAYVQSTGPLSICLDASSWSSYTGGVMKVCGKSIDHAVQAVGVNSEEGYWKVRNTWGTSWGEAGFIRLSYGSNTCNLAYNPSYVYPAAVSSAK